MSERDRLDAITRHIISAALRVHRGLGPGILESAYEASLAFELLADGLLIERQKPLPVIYQGLLINFNVTWLTRDGLHRVVNRF